MDLCVDKIIWDIEVGGSWLGTNSSGFGFSYPCVIFGHFSFFLVYQEN